MSTIHFHQRPPRPSSSSSPGLTDFGPGRSKLFKNSADSYLKVHHQGPREADVTEGSGGVWEGLHYDWSDPNHVKLMTTDSNVFGGAWGYIYTLDAAAQRHDRRRRGNRSRGQEPHGMGSLGRARNRRQALPGKGVRQQRRGHRRPAATRAWRQSSPQRDRTRGSSEMSKANNMTDTDELFLITGATGNTGAHTVEIAARTWSPRPRARALP